MISVRFSGPVAAMEQLRDAMKPAGAKRTSFKANNDGVSARVYVDFDEAASHRILAAFGAAGDYARPVSPAAGPVLELEPAKALPAPSPGGRLQVTWRR